MIKSIVLLAALLMILSAPSAIAIDVDGYKSAGEWDENWAFGQENGSTYDPNGPFGDRMVTFQTYTNGTAIWFDEDPKNDSGTNHDESMAIRGESSGMDIYKIYAHYDFVNDTLYGMSEAYGIPGDSDGNGNIATEGASELPAPAGPAGVGIGVNENWQILIQQDSEFLQVNINSNDWSVASNNGFGYGDVVAKFTSDQFREEGDATLPKSVYEISIKNISTHFSIAPGAEFVVNIQAGANLDTPPGGGGAPGEDVANVVIRVPEPDIDIEKSTNGQDADTPTGPIVVVGDLVTWTYNVTNTGDVPLSNIVVVDDKIGPIICPKTTLGVGESMECIAFDVIELEECKGQYRNEATVTGEYEGIIVTDMDPSHYFCEPPEPDIDIEKHTNGFDADIPKGPFIPVNGTVTWEYIVTNTGNVPLSNIVVVDDKIGPITCPKTTLGVGESMTCTVTDIVSEEECGQYRNEATVTGEYEGIVVTDMDPSHFYCEVEVPVLTPVGLIGLVGILGLLGIVCMKRRE